MIPVVYAVASVVATAVLCLATGAIVGIRLWNRYMRSFERMFLSDKYRNTAGAVCLATEVTNLLQDGASTDDLMKWLDTRGDELAERMRNPDVGADIAKAWREEDPPCPRCGDEPSKPEDTSQGGET